MNRNVKGSAVGVITPATMAMPATAQTVWKACQRAVQKIAAE